MKGPLLPVLVLPVITTAMLSVLSPQDSINPDLHSATAARRLAEAVRLFETLQNPNAKEQFLAGLALMQLHKPDEADTLLRASKEAKFQAETGWPDVDVLLARVQTFRSFAPPLNMASRITPDPAIAAYSGQPTAWSAPVLAAIPEFAAVGRSIFGKDIPPLRLYLFADWKQYDRFYEALFGLKIPTASQDGTGNLNVVTYCETDRQGRTTRAAGAPETISCVLHEFGHAWVNTYLMYRHGKDWLSPSMRLPWLDEGLADFIASLREPAFLVRRVDWLKAAAAKGTPAPTFEKIQDYEGFYQEGDVNIHYWISALFVAELLGTRDQASPTILKILDAAGQSGKLKEALRTVTGKDLQIEFERVVRRFW